MMFYFILLGVQFDLVEGLGWWFILEFFVFFNDILVMVGYFEVILIDIFGVDFMNGYFVGIKLGDVNGSVMEDMFFIF